MFRRSFLQLPLALTVVGVAARPAQAGPKAPSPTGDVHLVTSAMQWNVAHAIRHEDGRWDRFNRLSTSGMTSSLSSAVVDGEEHLVYQVQEGTRPSYVYPTYLRTRHLDGSWSQEKIGFDNRWGRTGIVAVNGELHIVRREGLEGNTGMLSHVVRHLDSSWSPVRQFPLTGVGASVANVNGVPHLVVSSGSSNTVLHLMAWQASSETWSGPVDTVELPHPDGAKASAAIAQVGADLHAVVRTSDHGLYHSIRRPDGSWTVWGDIGGQAGVPGTPSAIAVTASRNTLHLVNTTLENGLFHTIRFADGTWQGFGDVHGAAGDVYSYEVTIAGE